MGCFSCWPISSRAISTILCFSAERPVVSVSQIIIGRLIWPCVFAALAREVANDATEATDVEESLFHVELTGEDDAEVEGSSGEVRDANIALVNMVGYLGVKNAKEVVGGCRDGEIVRKAE